MFTETITWHEVADELPDADTTVLMHNPDWPGDPIELGSYGDNEWLDPEGWPFGTLPHLKGKPPVRWAHLPSGEKPK